MASGFTFLHKSNTFYSLLFSIVIKCIAYTIFKWKTLCQMRRKGSGEYLVRGQPSIDLILVWDEVTQRQCSDWVDFLLAVIVGRLEVRCAGRRSGESTQFRKTRSSG